MTEFHLTVPNWFLWLVLVLMAVSIAANVTNLVLRWMLWKLKKRGSEPTP